MKADWRRFVKISLLLVTILASTVLTAYAVDHSTHYKKLWFYTKWPFNYDTWKSDVPYLYTKKGAISYLDTIGSAAYGWEHIPYSPFDIYRVYSSNDANLVIESDDYGYTAYASPKHIAINEYWEEPGLYSHSEFRNTMLHEMGHAHGLGHYDCVYELMYPSWNGVYSPYTGDIAGIKDIY